MEAFFVWLRPVPSFLPREVKVGILLMVLFAPVFIVLGFFTEITGGAVFGLFGSLIGEVIGWGFGEAAALVCEALGEAFGEELGGQVGEALTNGANERLKDELRS